MVMDRAHFENSLASQLERTDLQDNGQHFENEYAADNDEQNLRFRQNRHRRHAAADAQRAGIAHEHIGRMRVEHQEAEQRADHRGGENRRFMLARMQREQIVNAPKAIAPVPASRPSTPSVKLTALVVANRMMTTNG